jgi:hypothetical protein
MRRIIPHPAAHDWPHLEGRTMTGIQTILHPTDVSENSRYAFQTACALARDYPCELARSPRHDALCVAAPTGAAARSAPVRRIADIASTTAVAPTVGPTD